MSCTLVLGLSPGAVGEGIRRCLESDPELSVLPEAAKMDPPMSLQQQVIVTRPDVLLIDPQRTSAFDSIELIGALRTDAPVTRIVCLAHSPNRFVIGRTSDAGAVDFVDMSVSMAQLIETIQRAARGDDRPEWSLLKK